MALSRHRSMALEVHELISDFVILQTCAKPLYSADLQAIRNRQRMCFLRKACAIWAMHVPGDTAPSHLRRQLKVLIPWTARRVHLINVKFTALQQPGKSRTPADFLGTGLKSSAPSCCAYRGSRTDQNRLQPACLKLFGSAECIVA